LPEVARLSFLVRASLPELPRMRVDVFWYFESRPRLLARGSIYFMYLGVSPEVACPRLLARESIHRCFGVAVTGPRAQGIVVRLGSRTRLLTQGSLHEAIRTTARQQRTNALCTVNSSTSGCSVMTGPNLGHCLGCQVLGLRVSSDMPQWPKTRPQSDKTMERN
jgi:hypothetical protein